jgi:molybdenum cofactor cytidylyltransferase
VRDERARPVAGVVLAAGSSTRMGRNKLLLPFEGESLLRRAVRRSLEARLAPVLVVVGHDSARAREELAGLTAETIENPDWSAGMQSSFRAGLGAVPEECSAAIVVLPDMPLVGAGMIAAVLQRYRETRAPLVLSIYGEAQAPPTLYDRSLFAELAGSDGEGCRKEFIRRHREVAAEVRQPAFALTDLDSPEDYERAKTKAGAREVGCAAIC